MGRCADVFKARVDEASGVLRRFRHGGVIVVAFKADERRVEQGRVDVSVARMHAQGLSGLREETSGLLSFLEVIASKGRGQKVPLEFTGKFLRTGIVMVSEEQKFETMGAGPYVIAAATNIEKGCDLIYVLAWGKKINKALRVVDHLKSQLGMEVVEDTMKTYEIILDSNKREAICAALKMPSTA